MKLYQKNQHYAIGKYKMWNYMEGFENPKVLHRKGCIAHPPADETNISLIKTIYLYINSSFYELLRLRSVAELLLPLQKATAFYSGCSIS